MRTLTIAGRTVLLVTYALAKYDGSGWVPTSRATDYVGIVRVGRKAVVTTQGVDDIRSCLKRDSLPWELSDDDINRNVAVGPKTLARIIEDALLYGHSAARKSECDSDYGENPIKFERSGAKHLMFTAPCGQVGRITNREAEKLVAALRAL